MDWARWLQERFGLSDDERDVLQHGLAELTPVQRRLYRRRLEPRLAEFVDALRRRLAEEARAREGAAGEWATALALRIVARGEPALADRLAIEVVGRAEVGRRIERLKRLRVAGPKRPVLS